MAFKIGQRVIVSHPEKVVEKYRDRVGVIEFIDPQKTFAIVVKFDDGGNWYFREEFRDSELSEHINYIDIMKKAVYGT